MTEEQDNNTPAGQMAAYLVIPFVLACSPIVGYMMGHWLDKWLDTAPYLTYLFLFLGFVAGVRETYRIIKKYGNGS